MAEKIPTKLSQYVDPTGEFTNKDMARSAWFVSHKILLRKILIGILLTWIVVAGIYALIILGAYLFSGYWTDRDIRIQTLEQFQDYSKSEAAYAAQALQINDTKVFQTGENYDFYALAVNQNSSFIARVKYKYVFEGGETPSKVVTLDPGKKIPLTVYGFQSANYPVGAKLVIEDTRWRKINPHSIADIKGYMATRSNFGIGALSIEHNVAGAAVPPRITFDIQNNTAYSYYEGRFALTLLGGGSVQAVIPLSIKNFRAGENFPLDIRPAFDISGIDDIEVIPLMDVFDSNEFLPALK